MASKWSIKACLVVIGPQHRKEVDFDEIFSLVGKDDLESVNRKQKKGEELNCVWEKKSQVYVYVSFTQDKSFTYQIFYQLSNPVSHNRKYIFIWENVRDKDRMTT